MEPIEIIMDIDRVGRLLSMFHVHEYHGYCQLSRTIGLDNSAKYILMDGKIYAFNPFSVNILVYDHHEFKKWVETKKTVKLL